MGHFEFFQAGRRHSPGVDLCRIDVDRRERLGFEYPRNEPLVLAQNGDAGKIGPDQRPPTNRVTGNTLLFERRRTRNDHFSLRRGTWGLTAYGGCHDGRCGRGSALRRSGTCRHCERGYPGEEEKNETEGPWPGHRAS